MVDDRLHIVRVRARQVRQLCRRVDQSHGAGGPLFERAQKAGVARTDMGFGDLLRLVAGITGTTFVDDTQRDRVLAVALDGVRTNH